MRMEESDMDYIDWFPRRLSELRIQREVSARDMSLSLGQSESYINKIENKRTLPSMSGFLYICEYLGISPQEFFDTEVRDIQKSKEIWRELGKLTPVQAEHVLQIIKDITEKA